jgi:hypothetical protein
MQNEDIALINEAVYLGRGRLSHIIIWQIFVKYDHY